MDKLMSNPQMKKLKLQYTGLVYGCVGRPVTFEGLKEKIANASTPEKIKELTRYLNHSYHRFKVIERDEELFQLFYEKHIRAFIEKDDEGNEFIDVCTDYTKQEAENEIMSWYDNHGLTWCEEEGKFLDEYEMRKYTHVYTVYTEYYYVDDDKDDVKDFEMAEFPTQAEAEKFMYETSDEEIHREDAELGIRTEKYELRKYNQLGDVWYISERIVSKIGTICENPYSVSDS